MSKKTLYVCRPLLNGDEVRKWASEQGFKTALLPHDMHVTIAFSREPVTWDVDGKPNSNLTIKGGKRQVHKFGEECIVLLFSSKVLANRWQEFRDAGASWDHDGYKPHITITYNSKGINLAKIEPYSGELKFGAERFSEISDGAGEDVSESKLPPKSAAKRLHERGRLNDRQYAKLVAA